MKRLLNFTWTGYIPTLETYNVGIYIYENSNTYKIVDKENLDFSTNESIIDIDNIDYINDRKYIKNKYNDISMLSYTPTYMTISNKINVFIGDIWTIDNLNIVDSILIDGDLSFTDGILTPKLNDYITLRQDDESFRPKIVNGEIPYLHFNKSFLEFNDNNFFAELDSISVFAIIKKSNFNKINPVLSIDNIFKMGNFNLSNNQISLLSGDSFINNKGTYINDWMMIYAAIDYTNNIACIYTNGKLDKVEYDILDISGYTPETIINSFIGKDENDSYFNGDIATLLISADKYYTATDINRLFGWAAHKYNLTHKLPINHPYSNSHPVTKTLYDISINFSLIDQYIKIMWNTDYTEGFIDIYRDDELIQSVPVESLSYIDDTIDLYRLHLYELRYNNSIIYEKFIFTAEFWDPSYYKGNNLYISGNNVIIKNKKISVAKDNINLYDFNQTIDSKRPVIKSEYLFSDLPPPMGSFGSDINALIGPKPVPMPMPGMPVQLDNIQLMSFDNNTSLENDQYLNDIDLELPLHVVLFSKRNIDNSTNPEMASRLSNIGLNIEPLADQETIEQLKSTSYINIGNKIYIHDLGCFIIENDTVKALYNGITNYFYNPLYIISYTFDFKNNNMRLRYHYNNDNTNDFILEYLPSIESFDNKLITIGNTITTLIDFLILNDNNINIDKYYDYTLFKYGLLSEKPPTIDVLDYFYYELDADTKDVILRWDGDIKLPYKIYRRSSTEEDYTYIGTSNSGSYKIPPVNVITEFKIEYNNIMSNLYYYPHIQTNENTIIHFNVYTGFKNLSPKINSGNIIQTRLQANLNYSAFDVINYDIDHDIFYVGNLYTSNFCFEITINDYINNTLKIVGTNNNTIFINRSDEYINNDWLYYLNVQINDSEIYKLKLIKGKHFMFTKQLDVFLFYIDGFLIGSVPCPDIYFDESYIINNLTYFSAIKFSKECPYNINKVLPSYDMINSYLYKADYTYNKITNLLSLEIDMNIENSYLYNIYYSVDNFMTETLIAEGIYTTTINVDIEIPNDQYSIKIKIVLLDIDNNFVDNPFIKTVMLNNVNFNIVTTPFGPEGPPQ